MHHGGLHRPGWLYATPRAHVRDVTVVAGLDGSTGTARYSVETEEADGLEVRVALRDADGAEVARARKRAAPRGDTDHDNQARAAATMASTPVLSVGWMTGARFGEWLVGMSCATRPACLALL